MRPRPIEVHPHSKGSKRFVVQDIIANHDNYFYITLNGKQKTDLYNKGVIDGTKKAIPLNKCKGRNRTERLQGDWLLVIPKEKIPVKNIADDKFIGRLGITNLYILKANQLENFLENFCARCTSNAEPCYKGHRYDCSVPNRNRHTLGRYSYVN